MMMNDDDISTITSATTATNTTVTASRRARNGSGTSGAGLSSSMVQKIVDERLLLAGIEEVRSSSGDDQGCAVLKDQVMAKAEAGAVVTTTKVVSDAAVTTTKVQKQPKTITPKVRPATAKGDPEEEANPVGIGIPNQDDAPAETTLHESETTGVGAYAVHAGVHDLEAAEGDTDDDEEEEDRSPDVLITAAEVYEETSEEFRQRESRLEEQIRQRIIDQSVQATNIVVQAVTGDEEQQQQEQPSTDGGGDSKGNHPQTSPTMALFMALLVVIIVVVLAVTLTRNDDKEPAAVTTATEPPTNIIISTSTNPPTPTPQLGDNWPPADTVLAQVPETLCLERMPLFGVTRLCANSSQELGSAVTNLVAQSRLWNFPEADLVILNAAEVRTDLAAGPFTREMGQDLLPFNNTLVFMEIEGSQLLAAMERALQKIVDDYALIDEGRVSGGSYPYGAGIRWHANMSESFPNRLSHIQVQSPHSYSAASNQPAATARSGKDNNYEWVPFNETKVYTVLTSSWLAEGGDGYNEFHRLDRSLVHDTGVDALTALIDYCLEHKALVEPPLELYSTQAYTNDLYNWSWSWDD